MLIQERGIGRGNFEPSSWVQSSSRLASGFAIRESTTWGYCTVDLSQQRHYLKIKIKIKINNKSVRRVADRALS